MRRVGLAPEPFAEALRRAHCAHCLASTPDHVCVGKVTIDRDGVDLECNACGDQREPLAPSSPESRDARAVVEAIGMSWSSLTPEVQRAAVAALGGRK